MPTKKRLLEEEAPQACIALGLIVGAERRLPQMLKPEVLLQVQLQL